MSASEISRFEPNSIYEIYSFKPVETKFGKTYILEDNDFNKYWANNKITNYINKAKFKTSNSEFKLLFKIKTGEYKEFKKGDDTIKFLEMNILSK